MTPETITAIQQALVPVAEKIGQTAEWGWAVVVRQMYVEAWIGVLQAAVSLIAAIVIVFVGIHFNKKAGSYSKGIPLVGSLVFAFMAVGLGLESATTAITHFINPEFYAIQFFIGLVK